MYTREQIEDAGLHDFRVFLRAVWAHLGLPKPTPAQLDMAYWLQHGPKRGILQAFRGVGKSWITVAFVLWTLLLDPQKKIMVVSANEALASDFTRFCFQLIHGMPVLQHLAPRADQRKASDRFDVGPARPSKDPSLKSVGITGQLTGSRADLIIPDDVEIPKNSYTHLLREKLSESVKEFGAILKPDEDARVIYLGTPQVENSIYVRLQERGYQTMIWPVEVPEKPEQYKGRLAPFVQDMVDRGVKAHTPVDPIRFPREVIDEKLAEYGRTGFALQFMLNTHPDLIEKHPLKLRDLIVMDLDEESSHVKLVWGAGKEQRLNDLPAGGFDGDWYHGPSMKSDVMAQFSGTVMYVDPSGKGSDETAYAIVRVLHSTCYLVAVGGFKDGYSEATLKALAVKALRHRVTHVVVEENFGGGMFTQLLRPWLAKVGAGRIDDDYKAWSRGQKEERILNVLEPLVQSHRLVVDRRVIEEDRTVQEEKREYSFVFQFTRMQRLKGALAHDDRVEAVAGACAYWTEKMAQDRDKAVAEQQEDLMKMELSRYMAHVTGIGAQESYPTWN